MLCANIMCTYIIYNKTFTVNTFFQKIRKAWGGLIAVLGAIQMYTSPFIRAQSLSKFCGPSQKFSGYRKFYVQGYVPSEAETFYAGKPEKTPFFLTTSKYFVTLEGNTGFLNYLWSRRLRICSQNFEKRCTYVANLTQTLFCPFIPE